MDMFMRVGRYLGGHVHEGRQITWVDMFMRERRRSPRLDKDAFRLEIMSRDTCVYIHKGIVRNIRH